VGGSIDPPITLGCSVLSLHAAEWPAVQSHFFFVRRERWYKPLDTVEYPEYTLKLKKRQEGFYRVVAAT
jgi:hypothetical protein